MRETGEGEEKERRESMGPMMPHQHLIVPYLI